MRGSLDAGDVSRILKIPRRTVYELVRRGDLQGFKAGRHVRTRPEWLEDFIRAQMVVAPEGRPTPSAADKAVPDPAGKDRK